MTRVIVDTTWTTKEIRKLIGSKVEEAFIDSGEHYVHYIHAVPLKIIQATMKTEDGITIGAVLLENGSGIAFERVTLELAE